MILDLKPKMIGDMAWVYTDLSDHYLNWICQTLKLDAQYLHKHDPEIICQATLNESITPNVGTIVIPPGLIDMFYKYDTRYPHGRPTVRKEECFNTRLMEYDPPIPTGVEITSRWFNPDVSKPETQMWMYYLATRYIDCGCEAIRLGESFLINKRDPGNYYLWSVAQKSRAYAAKFARRGVVLMDSHTQNGLYYDPPGDLYFSLQ